MCKRMLFIAFGYAVTIVTAMLSSCCNEEPIETNRFALTPQQTQLLPYQQGSTIAFQHSGGFGFNFHVSSIADEWIENRDHCGHRCCGGSYFSTQHREIVLRSNYPEIDLSLGMHAFVEGYAYPAAVQLSFHYNHRAELPYHETDGFTCLGNLALCFDSLELNGRVFYDLYKADFGAQPDPGNPGLSPRSVYYNDLGIVHLDMTNNDSFTLAQ
ncbi:MAG: hypothetical protein ACFCUH_09275 [Flavobacteriales bacterium]